MIRFIQIIAAAGSIAVNSAYAQSQPSGIQGDQPNRIVIDYIAPKDAGLQDLYEVLKIKRALERIQTILSPLRLPEELTVKTAECGKVDARYGRENSKPTITICYELLKSILNSLPKETTGVAIAADDAKIGQVLWLTLHEVGHATFDIFKVPVFGHEEDAADNFATYIMLQFVEARRLIVGAAWAWSEYLRDYKRNSVVQVRLAGFAADDCRRSVSIICCAWPMALIQCGLRILSKRAICPKYGRRIAKLNTEHWPMHSTRRSLRTSTTRWRKVS
jgi:hypothetical protein